MALQSKLFRGDAKLEAALISDSAHIVQGAAGAHVGKIQQALNELDGAGLKPDEKYGPATASAVLAYKQKRNIINHSYQTRAISALTASGLIKEVFNFDGPFLVAEPKVLTTSPGAVSKVFTQHQLSNPPAGWINLLQDHFQFITETFNQTAPRNIMHQRIGRMMYHQALANSIV